MTVVVNRGRAKSISQMVALVPGVSLLIWPKSVTIMCYWLIWSVTIIIGRGLYG